MTKNKLFFLSFVTNILCRHICLNIIASLIEIMILIGSFGSKWFHKEFEGNIEIIKIILSDEPAILNLGLATPLEIVNNYIK